MIQPGRLFYQNKHFANDLQKLSGLMIVTVYQSEFPQNILVLLAKHDSGE